MINIIVAMVLMGGLLAGCQPKESEQAASAPSSSVTADAQKEQRFAASKKLMAQAVALLEQKDLQNAVMALEASIKVAPDNYEPYVLMGQVLLNAKQYTQAEAILDQATKIAPNEGGVFYLLATTFRMEGKKLPAALAARRAAEIFAAAKDQDNVKKVAALLQDIISLPDDAPQPAANQQ